MAIKWRLVDIDDNTFDLDDGIFLVNNDNFKIDLDIEERTFLDGGIFDGISRMETKEMEFKFIKNFQSDSDYRDYFNEIIYEFRKAVKIQDIINSIETEIEFAEFSITYTDNSYLRVSENSILIYLKNVLWETINYTTVNIGGSSPTTSGNDNILDVFSLGGGNIDGFNDTALDGIIYSSKGTGTGTPPHFFRSKKGVE